MRTRKWTKEYMKEFSREDRWRRKILVLRHYSGKEIFCKCCGEKEVKFMSLDHIHGGGVQHRKKEKFHDLYKWIVKNNFPDGFQVLCFNCNQAKGHFKICPHQE